MTLALGYAAFWGLNVRRALAIQVYRNQALGIALIAFVLGLYYVGATASAYIVYGNPLDAVGNGAFGLFFVFLVTFFYWIDASALAFRRSDPRSRDPFRWSKLRIALWIGVLPAPAVVIPFDILNPLSNVNAPPPVSGLTLVLWIFILFLGIFVPLISGAVILPMIARRTIDPLLRGHLRWFAYFALAYLVIADLLGNLPMGGWALFFGYVGSSVGAYCLYRSVLFLAPVKASASESAQHVGGVSPPDAESQVRHA